MANRFEYNFTRESEYEELKERNDELEEENNLLKQSLEELIKVNTELTESIEELNSGGLNQREGSEDDEAKLEMLANENQNLRDMIEHQMQLNQGNKKSHIQNDEQTESLVNVLEELIESFKTIELKYEAEIKQLEDLVLAKSLDFEDRLVKVQQELDSRINTIEALSLQLKRKDENLQQIVNSVAQYEANSHSTANSNMFKQFKAPDSDEVRVLEKRLEGINKELSEKNKVIQVY